jgi:hypothetical protein
VGSTPIRGKTPTQKTANPTVEPPYEGNKLPEQQIDPSSFARPERRLRKHKISGAMAQQSCDTGWSSQSAPQKLLQLVGCREQQLAPKRPSPAKR